MREGSALHNHYTLVEDRYSIIYHGFSSRIKTICPEVGSAIDRQCFSARSFLPLSHIQSHFPLLKHSTLKDPQITMLPFAMPCLSTPILWV